MGNEGSVHRGDAEARRNNFAADERQMIADQERGYQQRYKGTHLQYGHAPKAHARGKKALLFCSIPCGGWDWRTLGDSRIYQILSSRQQ